MSIEMIDGKEALIELKNAEDGNSVFSGILTVAEGEELGIEANVDEGSKVLIEFAAVPEDENSDENSDENPDEIMEFGESGAELTIDQSAATTQEIDPADYQVRVTAQSKSNGKIRLHVTEAEEEEKEETQAEKVKKARKDAEANADEAAEGAGFDSVPVLYGVKTSLGLLGVEGKEITYKSEEGIVQITCPVVNKETKTKGKILVTIGKVLDEGEKYPGDIAFDDENDGPGWEKEISEETVTCYGDNEDDKSKVTKAGWENDEFKYEIRVESDDNSISLNEKDIETLVKTIMGSEETVAPDQTNQQQE